ncbi:hypothetical protein KXD97_15045 [Mycobacterium sp. SMC-8]|nr:hypothetical protein KXD97_15045 [Mycobacterium sp. SMC-8]
MIADAKDRGQPPPRFIVAIAANQWQKLRLARQAVQVGLALLRVRPHAVITTGASPGFFAIYMGRLLGARTVWVDSIANAQELSLSGRRVGRYCGLWLTQWEHLARNNDDAYSHPTFRGSTL